MQQKALVAGSAGAASGLAVRSRSTALAWVLGLAGAVACAVTLALTIALGLFSLQAIVFVIFIMTGLLGALVASREPGNSVGWLMCAGALAAIMLALPLDYAYTALVVEHGSWPLGGLALWLATWGWAPIVGMFFSMLTVRFPDGKVPRPWRFVDWLAIAGTALFALSIALAPASVLSVFLFLGPGLPAHLIAGLVRNPLTESASVDLLAQVRTAGLVVIVLAGVAAVASFVGRFRHARGEQRLQLKWFAYSGVLVGAALVFGAVATIFLKWQVGDANLPLDFVAFSLPLAVGIAILRYRLYDIDVIINRTLVYATLTAILGGVYVAGIEFLQRLFIFYTGQKSDTAIVITVFAVASLFTPVQKWVEGLVERRLGGRGPVERLEALTASVEAVTRVIDPHQVARRLVDDAVAAFEAVGGALYLDGYDSAQPFHKCGELGAAGHALEVAVRHAERNLGRLLLGHRRGHMPYSEHDRAVIQKSADALGEALAVGHELGHVHPAKPASM
ncbi:MAG TPA: hypothetical protein VF383_03525 [Candidatus Dormibacteraeota bacterium]